MPKGKRLLVVGIGNATRMDDGVGQYVVDQLDRWLAQCPPSGVDLGFLVVDTMVVHQLTPELCYEINEHDVTVFVDASVSESDEPVELLPVSSERVRIFTSHQWTAGSLVAITEEIFSNRPECYILSVRGRVFEFGEGLSPLARADAVVALSCLIDFVKRGRFRN
jgi:hydrogenase maturation protease